MEGEIETALALDAQNAAAPARIKIDIDRAIGEVHPHLFGNFAEHLGCMIYGGIYDEGSPLSDPDGYRKDLTDLVKKATHTFGDDRKVRPAVRTMPLSIERGGFTYRFPAHSLTILRVGVQ